MAKEETEGNDKKKKEEEILKSSGLRWRVLLSIIVSFGWLVFLILWFAFYALDYTVNRNIAITLVSILIMGVILVVSWASWGMKYCWKGENDKGKKENKWWQLKRVWVGFFIIIFVIAFGIAQPFLWYLFEKNPPDAVIDIANLLLILITLLAVGLTGFSVLIYGSLQEQLSTHITEGIKKTGDEVEKKAHMHIDEHVKEVFRRHKELSERTEKEAEIRQTLFRAQMLRIVGFTFWQLFLVWEEVKVKKRYFFSWDNVPGNDSEKLLRFLRDDLDIVWAENTEIRKYKGDKAIRICKDENSAEIIIDEKKEKATLKIGDGRTHDLTVKKENGKLNIYKKNTPDSHAKKIFEDLITIAIERAKRSLDFPEEFPIEENKEEIYKCRINWAYFLAESVRVEGITRTKRDEKIALKFSNEILDEVSKKDYPKDYYEFQENCAWVLQHFSEKEDKNSKPIAHDIIRELLEDTDIPHFWIEEIKNKWEGIFDLTKEEAS
jgi:hypothetical protein